MPITAWAPTVANGRWLILLHEIAKLSGLQRLCYTASHPREMRDLILAHRDLSVLMSYLHLLLQAGSDRILESMIPGEVGCLYAHWLCPVIFVQIQCAHPSTLASDMPEQVPEAVKDERLLLRFLPGDMRDKIDPYLRPLFDALHDMMSSDAIELRPGMQRHRNRTLSLYALAQPQRRSHHIRRSAKHHLCADEDVRVAHGHQ